MEGLSFPASEFERRLTNIQANMNAAGLECLIVTRAENIFYGCGFRAAHFSSWLAEFHALIIPRTGKPQMMTRVLERETARQQWSKPRLYMDQENPYELLKDILSENGMTSSSIGIEERFLKVSQLKSIRKHLPEAKLVDASGLVEAVAARPSQDESSCLRRAAKITNIGFEAGVAELREGVYPYQVIGRIHDAMYQAGQRDFDMSLVCVWSGPQGGRMHDTLSTERIRNGDIATIEIWGVDNQYKTCAQASIYIGKDPPMALRNAYDFNVQMFSKGLAVVKSGVRAGDIFDAVNSVYRPSHGTDYYRRCGGSMGLTVFTADFVGGKREPLYPGMAVLVQTLVDDPALLTCSSTVMVTEDGYEELTKPLLKMKAVA